MSRIWDLYVADPALIPIECLDNLVRSLCGRGSTKEGCGETSFGILIVETDGTILKNDTLKNSYDGADRFSSCWSVHDQSFAKRHKFAGVLGIRFRAGPYARVLPEVPDPPGVWRRHGPAPVVR